MAASADDLLRRGPFDPETVECPFAYYAALRDAAPVHKPEGGNWYVVSRYEDVQYVAMHPELFSSTLVAFVMKTSGATQQVLEMPEDAPRPADVLAIVDPPAHSRHRKLVNPAFNVRRVATLEPAVRAAARDLAGRMAAKGEADLMAE
ncbi:MAG: cytochrome P450, partial [Candidatus Methylomirabilis sp.]|nr:cytochrome P450 [Deltaproteobacteria bacterium]